MNTPSILKWGNTAHITKMSIEGIVAVASLALVSAITNPAGIAVLFIATTYFAAQAYCSWKQMHKNEEMKQAETAKTGAEEAESFKNTIEATIKGLATNPNYGLANKKRRRNRGLFRLHGIRNQDRKNMN